MTDGAVAAMAMATSAAARRTDGWTLTDWQRRLGRDPDPPSERFTEAESEGLDAPVRRYLTHAIAAGTPLAQCARLTMRGSIKLGRWLPFTARQILRPHDGFIWAARVAGVITGSDQYLDGTGGMEWKLGGLFTVAHEDGPDVSRSAAGRGGAEAIWLPTALLPRYGVRWTAHDRTRITSHYRVGSTPIDTHFTLNADGSVRSFVFDRWGHPDKTGSWNWYPFGGEVTGQRTFDGLTIPSSGRLAWHFGTAKWPAGEFFRYTITSLVPLSTAADTGQ